MIIKKSISKHTRAQHLNDPRVHWPRTALVKVFDTVIVQLTTFLIQYVKRFVNCWKFWRMFVYWIKWWDIRTCPSSAVEILERKKSKIRFLIPVQNWRNTAMADKQRTVVVAMDGSDQAIKSFKCMLVNCEWWTQSLSFIIMCMYTYTRVCMRIQRRDGVELVSSPLIIINWTKFIFSVLLHRKKGKYFFFDKQVNFFCSSNQHVVGSTRRIENKLTKNLYPKQVHM